MSGCCRRYVPFRPFYIDYIFAKKRIIKELPPSPTSDLLITSQSLSSPPRAAAVESNTLNCKLSPRLGSCISCNNCSRAAANIFLKLPSPSCTGIQEYVSPLSLLPPAPSALKMSIAFLRHFCGKEEEGETMSSIREREDFYILALLCGVALEEQHKILLKRKGDDKGKEVRRGGVEEAIRRK